MAGHIRHTEGSFESFDAAASTSDINGSVMDYDTVGGYAQFGGKGPGSVGVKIRSVLAGVLITALAFTPAGAASFVGDMSVAATSKVRLDGSLTGDTYLAESSANVATLTVGGTASVAWRSGSVAIPAANKLFLDGVAATGDTYLWESSANIAQVVAGGSASMVWRSNSAAIPSGNPFYLDGGGDTYIVEGFANAMEFFAGAVEAFRVQSTINTSFVSLAVSTATKLYFDGGGDTYMYEISANQLRTYVGAGLVQLAESTRLELHVTSYVSINPTVKFYLDGGSDTYLHESSANVVTLVTGATSVLRASAGGIDLLVAPNIPSATKFYLDGGGDTYIWESAGNVARLVVGGTTGWYADTSFLATFGHHLSIDPTYKLYFDGGGDTYMYEYAANAVQLVCGGITHMIWATGNTVLQPVAKLYFDGGSDSYIVEESANTISTFVGGLKAFRVTTSLVSVWTNQDFSVEPTKKIYVDGSGDSYIYESAANVMDIYTAGVRSIAFSGGGVYLTNIGTTASAANVYTDPGNSGMLSRSTSSLRYKKNVSELTYDEAAQILFGARPSVYNSRIKADGDRQFIGFIAEYEALNDKRLLHFDKNGNPDAVMYERYVVPLVKVVQRQKEEIEALKDQVAQLTA